MQNIGMDRNAVVVASVVGESLAFLLACVEQFEVVVLCVSDPRERRLTAQSLHASVVQSNVIQWSCHESHDAPSLCLLVLTVLLNSAPRRLKSPARRGSALTSTHNG